MSATLKSKMSREAQHATAFYSKGPYSAHSAITCAVIRGPDDFHQTTATTMGGHRLAELLNHVDRIVNEYPSDISPNTLVDAREIVAHAVARSLGWRLELSTDRKARLESEMAARKQAEHA